MRFRLVRRRPFPATWRGSDTRRKVMKRMKATLRNQDLIALVAIIDKQKTRKLWMSSGIERSTLKICRGHVKYRLTVLTVKRLNATENFDEYTQRWEEQAHDWPPWNYLTVGNELRWYKAKPGRGLDVSASGWSNPSVTDGPLQSNTEITGFSRSRPVLTTMLQTTCVRS